MGILLAAYPAVNKSFAVNLANSAVLEQLLLNLRST